MGHGTSVHSNHMTTTIGIKGFFFCINHVLSFCLVLFLDILVLLVVFSMKIISSMISWVREEDVSSRIRRWITNHDKAVDWDFNPC